MISYEPLFQTLKKKGITKRDFYKKGSSAIQSINSDCDINLSSLDTICSLLDCKIEDVICNVSNDVKRVNKKYKVNWEKLTALCNNNNTNLSQLAKQIGKSVNALTSGKKRNTALSLGDLREITQILNCDFKELIFD